MSKEMKNGKTVITQSTSSVVSKYCTFTSIPIYLVFLLVIILRKNLDDSGCILLFFLAGSTVINVFAYLFSKNQLNSDKIESNRIIGLIGIVVNITIFIFLIRGIFTLSGWR